VAPARALRFQDAAAYKMQLLQRAHAAVLERLHNEWDTERLPVGVKVRARVGSA